MTLASPRRRLLAYYIDFLVFTALYAPLAWALRSIISAPEPLTTVVVFILLRVIVGFLRLRSPGESALGLDSGPSPMVHERLFTRERWWTMVAAVMLVLDGSKNVVRWTQGLPVEPLFGLAAPAWMATSAITALGAVKMMSGLLVFRTQWIGAAMGLVVLGVEMAAALVHREDFLRWAGQSLIARRAMQGRELHAGELQQALMFTSVVLPVVSAIGALWLVLVLVRFRSADRGVLSSGALS